MTKAYLINGRIVLDVDEDVKTSGIQGQFCGQYDEGIGRYIGDFTSLDGRQFTVYKDGAMEWYDFEPEEEEQASSITGYR